MKQRLNIVADANMPHLEQLFGDFANITRIDGRAIRNEHLKAADVLLCRSITSVDEKLLNNTAVKFVGTATIGIDHLQIDWLNQQGINWANAAGCNAAAVAQYVLSAIAFWLKQDEQALKPDIRQLSNITVGIVGAGHVGSQLAQYLDSLGVKYQLCDPPLLRAGDKRSFVGLDAILECDVITLHVPMTKAGRDATWHMIDGHFLEQLKPSQLLINAARGGVIDNIELDKYLRRQQHAECVLDVFENEPDISLSLARNCLLATPHIAGHTLEGKSRGSFMIYQALCRHFSIEQNVVATQLFPVPNQFDASFATLNTLETLLRIYDIYSDSERLLNSNESSLASHFDQIRKSYASFFKPQPRRDYSGWQVSSVADETIGLLFK